jgi:spoIIIJ-associated protein
MSTETIEIEEKSIDEAIEKACREFNVPREKLNIEIISEGSSGFWGVLSKKAKIRASLLSLNVSFELNDDYSSRIEAPPEEDARQREEEAKPKKEVQPKGEARQREETRTKKEAQLIVKAKTRPEIQERQPAPIAESPSPSSASVPAAKEILTGILERMSFECQVAVEETPEKIILNIEGDTSGLLIGKHGQNLDAIQYILSKAVNKSDAKHKMIEVDSEAYRKRREESLLNLVQRIRDKVKKTKKPVSLSHMNAHDRRIIHLALQEDETLCTKSRGEGEYRKIVILPARRGNVNESKARMQE